MKFKNPTITDHGSIAENTFYRCNPTGATPDAPPKNYLQLQPDKFNECSHS